MGKKVQSPSLCFGIRLRQARERVGLAQDKLGVMIGLDEGSSSARISRYETGVHQPPFETAHSLAQVLRVPVAFFYCEDDWMAETLLHVGKMNAAQREQLTSWLGEAV